jgi:hypothetical protein
MTAEGIQVGRYLIINPFAGILFFCFVFLLLFKKKESCFFHLFFHFVFRLNIFIRQWQKKCIQLILV